MELVYSDMCGPMNTTLLRRSFCFLTFVDDYSRKIWAYFLERKLEVFDVFKEFKMFLER